MAISAAEKMRRYRDRKRRGKCILPMEVDRGEIADDLVAIGILKEWDCEDVDAIRLALSEALKQLKRYR